MATTTTMQGIWNLLQSLSLTNRNKKWLADKLISSIPPKKKVYSKEDQEILDGFRDAISELKDIKAGRIKPRSLDDFIAEVEQKEAAGYYD